MASEGSFERDTDYITDRIVASPSGDDDWVSQMLAESLLDGHDPIDLRESAHQGEPVSVDGNSVTSNAANGSSAHPPPSHRPAVSTLGDRLPANDGVELLDTTEDVGDNSVDPSDPADGHDRDALDGDGGDAGDGGKSDGDDGGGGHASFGRFIAEWVVVLVGAVAFALVLRVALFQAFWIPSESMESTLQLQDRVLVNKVSYRLHDVNRGDVVVFRRPDEEQAEIRDLIKRVIGLPGEKVVVAGGVGR